MSTGGEIEWMLKGRCYKLGHDVPHSGGVVPNHIIIGRHFDPADIIPHLFEETDPGFHTRCRPGDIIVAGRNFGMGPKMNGYIAMQALGLGLVCESMPFLGYRAAVGCGLRVMSDCVNLLEFCDTGDALEVDFSQRIFYQSHARHPPRISAAGGWIAGNCRARRQHRLA